MRFRSCACHPLPYPDSGIGVRDSGKGVRESGKRVRDKFSLAKNLDAVRKGMTQEEQVEAFIYEFDNLIDRFTSEFDMTLASIIGALECVKLDIWEENKGDPCIKDLK